MSAFGDNIKVSVFGQSHSAEIGMTMTGIPAGKRVDEEVLQRFLDRRAPGKSYSTPRKEPDRLEFVSGIKDGLTDGGTVK